MKKALALLLALVMTFGLSTGALATGSRGEIHWGIPAGIETVDLSGTFDIGGNVPVQRYDVYMTMDSLISGLMNGRSDACYINRSIADYITNRNDGIESELMPEQGRLRFMMGVNAEKPDLYERLNEALNALIDDGTVKRLTEEWIDNFPADREPDFKGSLSVEGATETIVVGVTGDMPPIDYVAVDGTPSGFNVALLQKLGQTMGVNIKLLSLASEARIVALASGRIDVAFWINSVDAFQGNFIDGVLLTDPYASSEICMIYTAGERERIMRTVNQIHAAENILAISDMDEVYDFGHADPSAMDALVSLIYEAPELALALTESESARAWTLSLDETPLASGCIDKSGATAVFTSTLTPGISIQESSEGAPNLLTATRDAAYEAAAHEVDGQAYAFAAPLRFGLASDALLQLKPLLAYLGENGSIGAQADDMLELTGVILEGTLYKNETGDAFYMEASAAGANGSRIRFFGAQANGEATYTLLLAKGDASLEDSAAFRAGVADGSIEGMALEITESGTGDDSAFEIDGVSTNYGMLHAPHARFGIRAQRAADGAEYVFNALGIDILRVEVARQSGDASAPADGQTIIDGGDALNATLQESARQGLEALRQTLSPVAPLTGDYLASIMKAAE